MKEKRFTQDDLDRLELRGIKVYKQPYRKVSIVLESPKPLPVSDELIFTIPGELCTLNEYINAERTNRYIAAKIKRNETYKCNLCASLTKVKLSGKWNVAFSWYRRNSRSDPDNIAFSSKFILDGCVASGLLAGDSMNHIGSIGHDFFIDKRDPRVEVRFYR
jgi:hypothetical protein